MRQTLTFNSQSGATTTTDPLQAVVQTITTRCAARGAVLLIQADEKWTVAVSNGCAKFRLPQGSCLDVAANPSLQLDGQNPSGISVEPDPFTIAMGPMAHWDWAICPVVTQKGHVATLYLFSDWDRPFTSTQVELATFGAEMLAQQLPQVTPPQQGEKPLPTDQLALAVSLLNHDLRSPINAILGFAELLAEGGADAETVTRYATIIAKGGNNTIAMLDQTVTLMRMLLKKIEWEPTDSPLSDALIGLNASGAITGNVCWDSGWMRTALAELAKKTGLENSDQVVVSASETDVHITVGIPGEGEAPLADNLHHAGVQIARQVILYHRGDIRSDELGTWFQVTVPRRPNLTID